MYPFFTQDLSTIYIEDNQYYPPNIYKIDAWTNAYQMLLINNANKQSHEGTRIIAYSQQSDKLCDEHSQFAQNHLGFAIVWFHISINRQ